MTNTQVRADNIVMHRVYIVLQDFMKATLTCWLYLQQLCEVWTKNFKSSPAEEDDVKEDDVEMTGGGIDRVFSSVGKQNDVLKKKLKKKTGSYP